MYHRHWFLFLAPAIMCLLDVALTLAGQPPRYWYGEYHSVNELSPDMNRLLMIHPTAFLAGVAGWLVMVATLLLLLPRFPALIIACMVTLGHTVGAATWLVWKPPHGYQITMGLCATAGILLAASIMLTYRVEEPLPQGKSWLRWLVIGILVGIGVYAFLIPH